MRYDWQDTDYYLKNYNQIKLDLNLYLVSNIQEVNEKLNVQVSKTGKENERSLISKLDDEKYKKDYHAIKCVDDLYKNMNSRERDIMMNKYINRFSNAENARKTFNSQSTVDRVINAQRKLLLKKFNLI